MVNVICMKWGQRYGAVYVNNLRNMVRRHLSLSHRFVCFTDDPVGISPDVEVFPLPEVRVPSGPERFWNKVGVFSRPLEDLTGPALCLDLDLVIVDSIDCFFEFDGRFCIVQDYRNRERGLDPSGNTSVCRFEIGAYPEVVERFHKHPERIIDRYWMDQQFICDVVKPLTFWPEAWCPSFKKHCIPRVPQCYFQKPVVPPGARIVVFHGHPNPPDAVRGCRVRGGVQYCRKTPWVSENWR